MPVDGFQSGDGSDPDKRLRREVPVNGALSTGAGSVSVDGSDQTRMQSCPH